VQIALLSDTHLSDSGQLPEPCLELLWSADLIVHAGDLIDEPVLDELESIGAPLVAVHGNMDSEGVRRRLPAETVVDLAGAKLAVVHDAGHANGRIERLRLHFPEAHAVVFGHSHMPLHEADGDFQIFNPGSPTQRRRAPQHTMGVARVKRRAFEFELVELG
jgi:hypothetical protein